MEAATLQVAEAQRLLGAYGIRDMTYEQLRRR